MQKRMCNLTNPPVVLDPTVVKMEMLDSSKQLFQVLDFHVVSKG